MREDGNSHFSDRRLPRHVMGSEGSTMPMADNVRATTSRAKATPAGIGVLLMIAGIGMTTQAIALPPETSWWRWLGPVVLAAGAALFLGAKVTSR